jgi:hypothetical protein
VDEYLALRRAAAAGDTAPSAGGAGTDSSDATALSVAGAAPDAAAVRAARKELARVERQLDRLRDRVADVHRQMAESASDHERVLSLDVTLRDLEAERSVLEDRWLELAEAVG